MTRYSQAMKVIPNQLKKNTKLQVKKEKKKPKRYHNTEDCSVYNSFHNRSFERHCIDKVSDSDWYRHIDNESLHNCSVYSNCIDDKVSDNHGNSNFDIDTIHNCSVYGNCIDDKVSDSH